ncbi:hypothetical protein GCM10018951_04890 [Pseudarthrobacter polychromogenes]
MAARNGFQSRAPSSATVEGCAGRLWWESTVTEPCPGKCFTAGSTPAASIPCENATPSAAAASGSADMDLAPMVGSAGPMVTSVPGAKSRLNPRGTSSAARPCPASRASGTLPAAP